MAATKACFVFFPPILPLLRNATTWTRLFYDVGSLLKQMADDVASAFDDSTRNRALR